MAELQRGIQLDRPGRGAVTCHVQAANSRCSCAQGHALARSPDPLAPPACNHHNHHCHCPISHQRRTSCAPQQAFYPTRLPSSVSILSFPFASSLLFLRLPARRLSPHHPLLVASAARLRRAERSHHGQLLLRLPNHPLRLSKKILFFLFISTVSVYYNECETAYRVVQPNGCALSLVQQRCQLFRRRP